LETNQHGLRETQGGSLLLIRTKDFVAREAPTNPDAAGQSRAAERTPTGEIDQALATAGSGR
jgi:hypothetical protein